MHEFIVENRDRILARTEDIVGRHVDRGAGAAPVLGTLPSFLDEIAGALAAGTFEPDDSISGERSIAAATQGVDRYRAGFEPAMVVRCFGALCDSIAALAEPHHICFDARELRILNQAVDSGIAWAMDAYSSAQREQEHATAAERIGVLAHELRNALSVATVGFGALQDGHVGMSSRTARTGPARCPARSPAPRWRAARRR